MAYYVNSDYVQIISTLWGNWGAEGCVLEQQGVQGCVLDRKEYRGVSRGVCLEGCVLEQQEYPV